jgi:glycerol-3-phosphate acyltransferase PlsY
MLRQAAYKIFDAFRGEDMILQWMLAIVLGYALGALPTGYLWLKLFRRQDITKIGSGRTGGTNAMRAGGTKIGILTMLSDFLKGYLAAYFANMLGPGEVWAPILAGVASVLGHNWSLWLYWWTGKLSAGAGTGPNVGGAIFFWFPFVYILVPVIALMVVVVGYASVASITVALLVPVIFYLRYLAVGTPWEYAVYGVLTAILVILALRGNIQRLLKGTENRVGIFAKKKNGG